MLGTLESLGGGGGSLQSGLTPPPAAIIPSFCHHDDESTEHLKGQRGFDRVTSVGRRQLLVNNRLAKVTKRRFSSPSHRAPLIPAIRISEQKKFIRLQ
ncbi:hypothetical protein EYF80_039983 [Liparis tanakae]|uniref:Uncharacterized protein n=1 Tax=Liparis tanakae TaxID=230148 RepID=A0A4Z2G8I1_9TELE|nr:hypothetical protein EYF80_039983 [Liparis tanakae]